MQTPTKLNKQQRDLLKQLGELSAVENTPHSHGIMDRVKEMFS